MKYTSNAKYVIQGIKDRLQQISGRKPSEYSVGKVVRTVALEIYASNLRRIHNEGLSVSETEIGKYSTKPTLIGAKSFVNKTSVAKAFGKQKNQDMEWRTIKRKGRMVRLAVLPGGYKQIRQIEGREVSHVNLQRTGRLMKDYAVSAEGKDWVIGFTSDYGKKVREGQEKHWGKMIWGVSRSESKIVDKVMKDYVTQLAHA